MLDSYVTGSRWLAVFPDIRLCEPYDLPPAAGLDGKCHLIRYLLAVCDFCIG